MTAEMTPELWRRIEELFYAALELAPQERQAFLATRAGDDEVLRREVEQLLDAGFDSGRVQDVLARGLDSAGLGPHPTSPPERLGPYRVIRELGRGGLGTVYLAERDDEHYSMQVAIKLVRRGLDTDDILDRLRQERQILARLAHPNITRLFDGGSTADGQPYLVMEYVDGVSLDTFAKQHRSTVRQRLRLALDVCSAVAMAHRNLVIHRDIKPSNVLVTNTGTVKLLDFGIAKLLTSEAEIEPTSPAQRLLTPEYASPEQSLGLPLSTATDIYSLGATIYHLLTGTRPRAPYGNTDDAGLRPPSERLADFEETETVASLGDLAAERGTSPTRLRQQLRGDLDNILMKAMAEDPQERYGSVAELADDLQRYLEDRPVRARAPSLAMQWWKFLRRNRLGASAAAVVVLSLLAGVSATTWQAQRARRAQAVAEQVSTFLGDLLEASKPEVSRGETVPVRSVLDRGAERIANELTDEPEVQTRLMNTMGQAYLSLGHYDRAADIHREELAIRRRYYGEKHLAVAESAHALADALIFPGHLEEAERWFSLALDIRRQDLGPDHPDVAETLNQLGVVYRRLRRPDDAERALQQALDIYGQRFDSHHLENAGPLNNLGVLYLAEARFEEAESFLRQANEIQRNTIGERHPDTLSSLGNLARALRLQGQWQEATDLLRTVLADSRKVLGHDHRTVASTLNSLAKALAAQGQLSEAAEHYRQAIEVFSRALGDTDLTVAQVSINLGEVLLQAELWSEAEQTFRRSISILRQHPEHPELARALGALGALLTNSNRALDAEPLLREALDIRLRVHSPESSNHWRVAVAREDLAACLWAQDRILEAEPLLQQAHSELQLWFGDDHPRTRGVAEKLASLRDAPKAR